MKSTKRMYLVKLNKLAIITIVILTLFNCANKKQKDDWEIDGLKGKVKSYSHFTYKAIDQFGVIEKDEMIREYLFQNFQVLYDEKGNMIEENRYKSDGSLDRKSIYKYDKKGNVIEGNKYESDGSLDSKNIYKYDKKGNKIEENRYKSDGSLDEKYTFKYDEKGNMIEENRCKSGGSLDKKYTYKYDNKGNMIEENRYKSDNRLESRNIYKYDDKGNMIEDDWTYILFNGEEKITKRSYTYEYDKHENWTKRIEFKDEFPKEITEREFEYYE